MQAQQPTISRVLVIAAHPDDIEFGVAGTVAMWTDQGIHVTYCLVTDGAAGSNDPGVNYVELVERRREEQLEAARCVGVQDVRFLGYSDGTLVPSMELRRDLTRLIREIRPDRVVIMDPTVVLVQSEGFNYINHPDHRASGEAALYAIFPSAETRPIFPELLDEGLEPFHVNEVWLMLSNQDTNRWVDVTAAHDRKLSALLCHRSQLGEEVKEFVVLFDSEEGKKINVQFAEAFRVLTFYPPSAPVTDGAMS